MRDLDRLIGTCAGHGANVGIYAERLLDDPLPWTRMRAVYRLLGLVQRYGAEPVEAACTRALDLDVVSVAKIASMLEKGLRGHPATATHRHHRRWPVRPPDHRVHHPTHQPRQRRNMPYWCGRHVDPGPPRRTRHALRTGTPMTTTTRPAPAPLDPIGADLTRTLRALKLGQMTDTLPERLVLARQQHLSHAAFLDLVLSDEVTRREGRSAALRAAKAGLDPTMRLDTFDDQPDLSYDRQLWSDLTTLRFTEAGAGVLILGPVGVGKTHLATALGHIAIRRRMSVGFHRADKLFTRLRAARLDNTLDAELRRLTAIDLLIIDDFALRALDPEFRSWWAFGRV